MLEPKSARLVASCPCTVVTLGVPRGQPCNRARLGLVKKGRAVVTCIRSKTRNPIVDRCRLMISAETGGWAHAQVFRADGLPESVHCRKPSPRGLGNVCRTARAFHLDDARCRPSRRSRDRGHMMQTRPHHSGISGSSPYFGAVAAELLARGQTAARCSVPADCVA